MSSKFDTIFTKTTCIELDILKTIHNKGDNSYNIFVQLNDSSSDCD